MSSIINKINETRDAFDNDRPDEKVWENIHKGLHSERKKKPFPWLKLAAIFLIMLGAIWFFASDNMKPKNQTAQLEPETFVDGSVDCTQIVPINPVRTRKIIRGGNWNNIDYYIQPGEKSNLQKGKEQDFRPFRGNGFKTRKLAENQSLESQFYIDQTEIVINESKASTYKWRNFQREVN
jgi:hypothetical protein